MNIIIYSEGQNFGPYSEKEFQDLVSSGKFRESDLAWMDSSRSWVALGELATQSKSPAALYPTAPPATANGGVPLPPPGTGDPRGIIVNSDGQNYGPYPADQVREFIRWGIFRMTDFAWTESSKSWVRIVEALQDSGHPAPFQRNQPPMAPMPQQMVYAMAPMAPGHHMEQRPSKPLNPSKTKVIIRSGDQKFGPYNLNQVREFLLSGKFKESDMAWSAPLNSWVSLGEILDQLRVPNGQASAAPMAMGASISQPYVQIPTMAPMPVTPPAGPKRKVSGASLMNASSKNFGPSF